MDLKDKKVLVFGSGKSGIGAADLLGAEGARPVIYDGNEKTDKEQVLGKTAGTYPVDFYAGELPEEVLESLDLVVLSPGVPTDIPLVKRFYEMELPVWGEVELAYRTGKGRVLAITGTNGKTTTTALLGKIMKDACPSVFVVGNQENASGRCFCICWIRLSRKNWRIRHRVFAKLRVVSWKRERTDEADHSC